MIYITPCVFLQPEAHLSPYSFYKVCLPSDKQKADYRQSKPLLAIVSLLFVDYILVYYRVLFVARDFNSIYPVHLIIYVLE